MTHRENVLKKLNLPTDTHLSLTALSKLMGVPTKGLQEVYNRGVGAWKSNPQSVRLKKDFSKNPNLASFPRSARLTKEQWAFARVYSFLDKGKTYYTTDNDIAKQYRY